MKSALCIPSPGSPAAGFSLHSWPVALHVRHTSKCFSGTSTSPHIVTALHESIQCVIAFFTNIWLLSHFLKQYKSFDIKAFSQFIWTVDLRNKFLNPYLFSLITSFVCRTIKVCSQNWTACGRIVFYVYLKIIMD